MHTSHHIRILNFTTENVPSKYNQEHNSWLQIIYRLPQKINADVLEDGILADEHSFRNSTTFTQMLTGANKICQMPDEKATENSIRLSDDHRRRRRGAGGHVPPKLRKIFFGQLCKIRAFFTQKNRVKFRKFVNFLGKYH